MPNTITWIAKTCRMKIGKIRTQKQYEQVMNLIEVYLQKATEGGGFDTLSKKDAEALQQLSLLAEQYEDIVIQVMPLPVSLTDVVEQKRKELKLNQAQLAEMLEIGKPKLSQILNGKREPDVSFLKAIYYKLKIDPKFILEHV